MTADTLIDRQADGQLTISSALASTLLFSHLTQAELSTLAASCEHLYLQPAETLLSQGESGDRLYVVLAGRLRVTQRQVDGSNLVLGDVLQGEFVGEQALLENAPRMAHVSALTKTAIAALPRDAFESFLEQHSHARSILVGTLRHRLNWAAVRRYRPPRSEILTALAGFVGDVDRAVLEALEQEVRWVTLPRGELLMKQGDIGDCMYVLVSGRLTVFARREDGSDARIAEIGPGESVGEMALLSGDVRAASVEACRDCELLQLSKAGFDRLITHHPSATATFARIIVERLQRTIRSRSLIVQLRATAPVTEEECEDVVRTPNPILRNLKITQTYHRLSLELAALLGYEDVNWCTFACHASKTAGYAIRNDKRSAYRSTPSRSPVDRALMAIRAAISRALGILAWREAVATEVSRQISAGNLKVFAELAPIFARFVQTFRGDAEYDRGKLDHFLQSLRRGPTLTGGQDTLMEALSHYYDAMSERRPKQKTELILLATIKVGLHEQIRLQPEILCALNAPAVLGSPLRLRALSEDWASGVKELGTPTPRLREWHRPSEKINDRLLAIWAAFGRRLVTCTLMELRLPYGDVRLGMDLPPLPRQRSFPDALETLDHPELARLVAAYRREGKALRGSRALDWGNLDHRMSFIVDLFRSRLRSLELFEQPFLLAQQQAMEEDRIPSGPL